MINGSMCNIVQFPTVTPDKAGGPVVITQCLSDQTFMTRGPDGPPFPPSWKCCVRSFQEAENLSIDDTDYCDADVGGKGGSK